MTNPCICRALLFLRDKLKPGYIISINAWALKACPPYLAVSIDELLGEPTKKTNGKRGPIPKLQQQMERVSLLPRSKQKFVIEMIDTVIQQAG